MVLYFTRKSCYYLCLCLFCVRREKIAAVEAVLDHECATPYRVFSMNFTAADLAERANRYADLAKGAETADDRDVLKRLATQYAGWATEQEIEEKEIAQH